MWALYLDESGTTEPHQYPLKHGTTPIFTIGGVILPIEKWREYDRDYLYLKRDFFKKEIDKSSKEDTAWEIKGNDITSPRNRNSERNKTFTYKVFDIIKQYEGKALGVTFLKSTKNPMSRVSMYTKGLQIIAERLDIFLREMNSTGLMIVDSRMAHMKQGSGVDYAVAKSYLSFAFGNEHGRQLKRILEAPMFADSKLTAGIQIADIVAAVIKATTYANKLAPLGEDKELGLLDYTHNRRFWNPLKGITFTSEKEYEGHTIFGLRTIDQRDGPVTKAHIEKIKHHLEGAP